MTEEGLQLEYEYHLMETEPLKTCHRCGIKTHRKHCPHCDINGHPVLLTGDALADEAISRMQADEDVDLDELFKKGKFEPVPKGKTHVA